MDGLDVTISSLDAQYIDGSVLGAAVAAAGGDWHGVSDTAGQTTYHLSGDSDALAAAVAPVFVDTPIILVRSYWPDGTVANETTDLWVIA